MNNEILRTHLNQIIKIDESFNFLLSLFDCEEFQQNTAKFLVEILTEKLGKIVNDFDYFLTKEEI